MNNTFKFEGSMEELEIIKRGLKAMHSRYKMAYAAATTAADEQKQLNRAETAQRLLNEVEDIITQAKAEELEKAVDEAEEDNAE